MIQVICKDNVEDVLAFPQYYVDDSEDLVLLKIYHQSDISNPTYIMIGCNEDEKYYLVVEDNETSEDYLPADGQSMTDLYEKLLKENK